MDARKSGQFLRISAVVSNLVVLAGLGAIGWWGHHSHWTLPKFPAIFAAKAPTAGEAGKTTAASDSPERGDRLGFPNRLPAIEFRSAEAARNCGIDTEPAQKRSMDDFVLANAVVGYDQTHYAQLAVRVPGIVWRVEKRLGDPVQRGDILVIVDAAEVGQAKAALLEATVLHNLKTQNLRRVREIANSIPERDLREIEAAWEVSRVQRSNAVQKLVNLGFPIRLEGIAKLTADELTTRLQLLGLPESLEHETASANLIPLVAPFDGIITACEVVRGEMVEPSKPQYVIADTHRMWINLDVRQEDVARLRLGAPVLFQGGENQPAIPATLTWIGTGIDSRTRTIQARAEADNPLAESGASGTNARRLLQANAFGSAQISIGSNPAAVVVPNDALHWQWEIGHQVVFVSSPDGRHFEPRIVKKGLVRDDYAQIIEGLQEGERVVTAGSRVLASELSERLQARVGENAEAVRVFDDVTAPVAQVPAPSSAPGAAERPAGTGSAP